jgi:glycosyltransferase involved in cell wall biosynthesis
MVTQPSRLALAKRAIDDFLRQTHDERELVITHDGDDACDAALRDMAAHASIRLVRERSGLTLGALRNVAVDASRGDFVCQWDDDDRYHPQRIALQWRALRQDDADFCFLSDQLHWFPQRRELYWDDWDRETYPLNFVQGTLLGRRDLMPRYPDAVRGEDTDVVLQILRDGRRIARLRDVGWCYVYVYHGANAWDAPHHAAIPRAKAFGHVRLLQRERLLRARLAEYVPPLGSLHLPHENGVIEIVTPD